MRGYLRSRRAETLASIPGVGKATAAAMPELGGLDAKAAANLAGLAPVARESRQWQGKRFIQGGRVRVRRLLYMAAAARTTPISAASRDLRQAAESTNHVSTLMPVATDSADRPCVSVLADHD